MCEKNLDIMHGVSVCALILKAAHLSDGGCSKFEFERGEGGVFVGLLCQRLACKGCQRCGMG